MNETQVNKDQDCPTCNGLGYVAGHDLPTRHGEDGECVNCPIQVQCEACEGTGKTLTSNLNDKDMPF